MLTAKHIQVDGGEQIHLAHSVLFTPSDANSDMLTKSPIEAAHSNGRVTLTVPTTTSLGSYELCLHGGTVFVMNDLGKTVSRYDLGASPVPFNVDPHTLKAVNERQ